MTRGEMKYYLKVIRKGYKNISAPFGLANFVIIILAALFAFLLLIYEPASEWHHTTFTLSNFESRYANRYSSEPVLYLYTTDNRYYALNHNTGEIQYQLKKGQQYQAVYSDDFFHDIIRGLEDTEREYINTEKVRKKHEIERVVFVILMILSVAFLIIMNSLYANFCVREEKRRIQHRIKKRR